MDKIRLVLASALSPLIAGAIVTLLIVWLTSPSVFFSDIGTELTGFAVTDKGLSGFLNANTEIVMLGLLIGVLVGWPVMLISVLPLHSMLVRLRRHSPQSYAAIDAVAGTVLMMLIFGLSVSLSSDGQSTLLTNWPMWLSGPLAGGLVGLLFWRIRRPDLSEHIQNRTSRADHGVW